MKITRGHLKTAVDSQNWDLLDKMLEMDNTYINDKNYYTDSWGSWWGLLIQCIGCEFLDGVKILLKHGADKKIGIWGDGLPLSPIELATERKLAEYVAILESNKIPSYTRKSNPTLPEMGENENKINEQGDIADKTGLIFPLE